MARHKVGDSYLSDGELNQHNYECWVTFVFVCGAVGCSAITYYAIDPDWEKWIRFSLIILSGVIGGFVFAALNQVLARMLQVVVFFGIAYFVGKFIWSII